MLQSNSERGRMIRHGASVGLGAVDWEEGPGREGTWIRTALCWEVWSKRVVDSDVDISL